MFRGLIWLSAGVTGLTTALQLIRAGYSNITIIGRHLPSQNYADYYPEAAEYASPWAGVDWAP
jgi:glycine/D-amino acid oxidase-like deaminating enzyme